MGVSQITKHKVSFKAAALSSIDDNAGNLEIECALWGDLSKPLVVLMGGISATRWALDCSQQEKSGWWNQVVNEWSYLNADDHCFLTFEYFAFPEHINNPPVITTTDQADLLHQIQTKLNLPAFHAVIGSSYGGMVSLAFAAKYPAALERLICIAAADINSVKSQALRWVQRQVIQLGNQQSHQKNECIALARSLAMIGYRGEAELELRFQSKQSGQALDDIAAYLKHHGNEFAEYFSISRYLQLSQSIDFHQIDVSTIEAKTQLIGISTDQMVPVHLIENLYQNISAECHISIIDSHCGHDGFLIEGQQLNQIFQTFLDENNHDNSERNHRCASGY